MSSAASPLGSTAPAPAPAQNSSPSPPAAAAAPSATPLPPLSSSSLSSSSTVPPPPSAAPIPLSPNLPPPPPPPPPPPSPAAANSSPIATTTTHSSPKLTPPSPPSSLPSPPSSISTTSLIIAVGIGGLLFLSIITIIICCLCQKTCRRWKKKKKKTDHHPPQEIYGLPGGFPAHAIYKDSYDSPNLRADFSSSPFYSYNASSILNKSPPPPPPPPPLVVAPFKQGYDAIPKATPPGIANSKYRFTYEELEAATDGFSMSNKLGEGGFGCVYKGRVSGGQLVAVKQLKLGASQGEKEFQAEVEIISRVHHRHLVSLVGYCISEHQRLLVYDYVPNGTLEYHLHKRKNGPALDWSMRLRIACGAARGLAYLHEDCHPRIIHRDIKSSNILLDDKFEAQVSDFGLAKLTADTDTHVTTRVMGTFGYLAPEYASSGKLTEKSDVFSFGVVLLELLTGRKPVDVSQPVGEESLVEWARPLLGEIKSEVYLDIVADPDLNGVYDPKEMLRMVKAAAACVRHSASRRPRMGLVVRALEAEISLLDLDKGLRPGHISRDYNHEHGSSYNIEMRKFKELTLGSQEFEIKYSGTTSAEYKANQSSFMMSSGEYQQTIAGQGTRLTPEAVASSSSTTSSPTRQVGTPLDNHTPLSGLNRDMRSDRDQNVTTSPRSRFYQQTKGNRGTSSS